jgi:signal peptidase II
MALNPEVLLVGCILAVLSVDQGAKALVCRRLRVNESMRLGRRLQIARVQNRGPGWLALSSKHALVLWSVIVVAGVVVVVTGPHLGVVPIIGLGLALGGAGGNLLDRVMRKSVLDFIGVGRWPLFNLADVALTLGVCLTPLGLLL